MSIYFAFNKTGLLLFEQCSAILVSASSWFDVKRHCYWDCDINTVSFSIFKVVRPIKSFHAFSCVRSMMNFFSIWDLFLVFDRNPWQFLPWDISWLISPVCARKEAVDPVFLVLLKSIQVFRAIVTHKNGICRNGLYGLFQLVPFFE